MVCIYGLPKIALYTDGVSWTKKIVSCITPFAIIGNLMHSLSPLSFPLNPIKVALDLSNFDQLILIASKANQNIMFVELLLSTRSLYIVKFSISKVMTSASS